MSDGINRRGLIGVAGASLAVAACGEGLMQDSAKANEANLDTTGVSEPYGKNPHDTGPDGFAAQYIGVIDIRPAGGWKLDINHAAFDCKKGASEADRLNKAISALSGKRNNNSRFRDLKDDLKPYNRRINNTDNYDSDNFDQLLGFKSPNELFIFIEGDVELTPNSYLSFTPLGADLTPRNPNYAFFNAREIALPKKGKLNGRLIAVRNYMTDISGKTIGAGQTTEKQRYAMNIHFTVPGNGKTRIPMIIDPDTGNGAGNEP